MPPQLTEHSHLWPPLTLQRVFGTAQKLVHCLGKFHSLWGKASGEHSCSFLVGSALNFVREFAWSPSESDVMSLPLLWFHPELLGLWLWELPFIHLSFCLCDFPKFSHILPLILLSKKPRSLIFCSMSFPSFPVLFALLCSLSNSPLHPCWDAEISPAQGTPKPYMLEK